MKSVIILFTFFLSLQVFSQSLEMKDFTGVNSTYSDLINQQSKIISINDLSTKSSVVFNDMKFKKRLVTIDGKSTTFLFFIVPLKFTRNVGILETDLPELFSAIENLKETLKSDIAAKPSYFERYFENKDYFRVGYYIIDDYFRWFLFFDTRFNDSEYTIKDIESFTSLVNAVMQR